MMIIKVATDATVAITITKFLSSSGGFRLNGLMVFVAFFVVVAAFVVVVVIAVVMVLVLEDLQPVSFVSANRGIGS